MTPVRPLILAMALDLASPDTCHGPNETPREFANHVLSIAHDVADIVEQSPPIDGETHESTGRLVISWVYHESHFRKSVDEGRSRGDKGESWCVMQLRIKQGVTYWMPAGQRWSGPELVDDRRRCLIAGLEALRVSARWCSRLSGSDRYTGYTSGRCIKGEPAAARRVRLAVEWPWQGAR